MCYGQAAPASTLDNLIGNFRNISTRLEHSKKPLEKTPEAFIPQIQPGLLLAG